MLAQTVCLHANAVLEVRAGDTHAQLVDIYVGLGVKEDLLMSVDKKGGNINWNASKK